MTKKRKSKGPKAEPRSIFLSQREMAEILSDSPTLKRLEAGSRDARGRRGRFVMALTKLKSNL